MKEQKCIICDKPAEWIRGTQFAGDHPFCDEHAKQEKGFGTDDSYEYWYNILEQKAINTVMHFYKISRETALDLYKDEITAAQDLFKIISQE
jgi:hypothetical protein